MRISDWSSDVCSSDLGLPPRADLRRPCLPVREGTGLLRRSLRHGEGAGHPATGSARHDIAVGSARGAAAVDGRSPRIEVDQHPAARQPVRALTQLDIADHGDRSEEHTSELQSLMRISYAVFCLKKK